MADTDGTNRNRSPRALPLPPEEPAIEVLPRDQRSGFLDDGMSPWRRRFELPPSERKSRVILAYAKAKRR